MTIEEILKTEFSEDFVQKMKNRMIVSFHKYGPLIEGYPNRLDAIKSLKGRLDKYEETGNTEWLVDVSNFAMIEFMLPGHENKHFRATSSDESIGRTRRDRLDAHERNHPIDLVVERLKRRYLREER